MNLFDEKINKKERIRDGYKIFLKKVISLSNFSESDPKEC
jgi:hypothetical protein